MDFVYTGVEEIPRDTKVLKIEKNVEKLPELPGSIKIMWCLNVQISSLSSLPDGLKELLCAGSRIRSLPNRLPSGLHVLNCCNTPIDYLPSLPESLRTLVCGGTQITRLPVLPPELRVLDCSCTKITELPELPDNLRYLNCNWTRINILPEFPDELEILHCRSNKVILRIPVIPKSLNQLFCNAHSLPQGIYQYSTNWHDGLVEVQNNPYMMNRIRRCQINELYNHPEDRSTMMLVRLLTEMKEELQMLREEIKLMPGGSEYQKASDRFEKRREEALNND